MWFLFNQVYPFIFLVHKHFSNLSLYLEDGLLLEVHNEIDFDESNDVKDYLETFVFGLRQLTNTLLGELTKVTYVFDVEVYFLWDLRRNGLDGLVELLKSKLTRFFNCWLYISEFLSVCYSWEVYLFHRSRMALG